jgi:hypothetical protein
MFNPGTIDDLVVTRNYYADESTVREQRRNAIRMAHRHHYNNNFFYRENCRIKGIGESITPDHYPALVFPDSVFKSYDLPSPEKAGAKFNGWVSRIASVPVESATRKSNSLENLLLDYERHGLSLTFSSGTTGKFTFLPRDDYTRSIAVRSCVATYEAMRRSSGKKEYFITGLPRHTFLHIGYYFGRVSEAIAPGNVYYPYETLKADFIRLRMRGPQNLREKLLNEMVKIRLPETEKKAIMGIVAELVKRKGEYVVFLAAPYLLVETAKYVLENGIDCRLSPESILTSSGGFKTRMATSRDGMNKLFQEAFDVSPERYVDFYGMTETNSIMAECAAAGHKHVPPWIEPLLFDDRMEPLEPAGVVTGNYAFLEPSSRSFPGFILTGDRVTIDYETQCPCGCKMPIVQSIGRALQAEGRGCSGVLSRATGVPA